MSRFKSIAILILLICALEASRGSRDLRGGTSFVRRSRRIELNEYLVPPPPPRSALPPPGRRGYTPTRFGRVMVNPPRSSTEAPGYFSNLMSWLNPFGGLASFPHRDSPTEHAPPLPPPPLPPPPPPPSSFQPSSHRPGPPPSVNLAGPLPGSRSGGGPGWYSPANKGKQCNPCNRVPWLPMESGEKPAAGYPVFPPLPPARFPHSGSPVYLPPNGEGHEVRTPDFSQSELGRPPAVLGLLPDPHLYPGPVPPLYKAEPFAPPQPPSPPSPAPPDQSQLLHLGSLPFEGGGGGGGGGGSDGASIPSNRQPDGPSSSFQANRYAITSDSGPTATEHREFGQFPTGGQDRPAVESFATSTFNEDRSPSYGSADSEWYRDTPPPSFASFPNLYEASDPGRTEFEDLSSSSSIVKDSRVALVQHPVRVRNHPVQFEQSPLLDLTNTAERDLLSSTTSPLFLLNQPPFAEGSTARTAATITATAASYSEDFQKQLLRETGGSTVLFENQASVPSVPSQSTESYSEGNDSRSESSTHYGQNDKTERETMPGREDRSGMSQKSQTAKRNKQVQVIIPYTSDYTPVPFHQPSAISDWSSFNGNPEKSQPRKATYLDEPLGPNHVGQESRNEERFLDLSGNGNKNGPTNFTDANNIETEIRPTSPALHATIAENKSRHALVKLNSSIDVHRLQKNIDNWTIQEYSRAMTSSTALPSSARPYLLPSKKIPDEYLTTTEPADRPEYTGERHDTVKTYSLAGFSFNDLEHEPSASDRVEKTSQIQVVRVEESDRNATNRDSIVSVSSSSKERVYVVTPQPLPTTSRVFANGSNLEDFEAIERAYQVLPQAVNNLAVASTGKENVPLWGIMEHEEFASLTTEDRTAGEKETSEETVAVRPILYAGHSKVRSQNYSHV